jgi:hypothetical protein
MLGIRVVLQDGTDRYYLLKVERRDFDVYCFVPRLGAHFSKHRSGESHFKNEGKPVTPEEQAPVIMIGLAGQIIPTGILDTTLADLGVASRICTLRYPITSLSQDFQRFTRRTSDCCVIDTCLFPKDTTGMEVGVWAVPARNQVSFEYNNPGASDGLLFRAAQCEPQIWIYARPAPGWFS